MSDAFGRPAELATRPPEGVRQPNNGGDVLVTRHQNPTGGTKADQTEGLPAPVYRLGEGQAVYFGPDAPEPFFVDWLSLYQDHEHELPVVDAGCVMGVDEHGELVWKTTRAVRIEGSHDSSVNVRCDGHRVSFDGNVSRFGRPSNLFGFSLAECMRRVNELLQTLGLPPFTMGRKYHRSVVKEGCFDNNDRNTRSTEIQEHWTGCRVTRIDLTANYGAGSLSDAHAYMAWLSTQQQSARIKVGTHFDGETVDWGRGSRRVYAKCYLKSSEMARHGAPGELIEFCEHVGLIRFEVTVKSTQLISMGCQYLGSLDMHQLELLFEERRAVMGRAEHTHDDLEQLPNHFRRTARDYLAGDDLAKRLPRNTFWRHRKALLPYGLDIAVKRNVIEFKPRVRVIELRPLTAADLAQFEASRRAA